MNHKKLMTAITVAFFLIISSALPTNAAKPNSFTGICVKGWNGIPEKNHITFSNVPGGTYYITAVGIGYLTNFSGYGFGSTDLNLITYKPFEMDALDNDYVYRQITFDNGAYTQGYVTYTGIRATAYSRNGSMKTTPITINCV